MYSSVTSIWVADGRECGADVTWAALKGEELIKVGPINSEDIFSAND